MVFMFQRAPATFIKISQVTQSSPQLFAAMVGRLPAVYCKYLQALNLQPALTVNKKFPIIQYEHRKRNTAVPSNEAFSPVEVMCFVFKGIAYPPQKHIAKV